MNRLVKDNKDLQLIAQILCKIGACLLVISGAVAWVVAGYATV